MTLKVNKSLTKDVRSKYDDSWISKISKKGGCLALHLKFINSVSYKLINFQLYGHNTFFKFFNKIT